MKSLGVSQKAMNSLNKWLPLAGRVLLSLIFIMSGLGKIFTWEQTAGYMASAGMPMVPFFLVCAILLEMLGGLSLMLGLKSRIGAAALILFLIPATFIFHHFWTITGPDQQGQMINFMKNIAIIGGLATVVAWGSGPLSLDAVLRKSK